MYIRSFLIRAHQKSEFYDYLEYIFFFLHKKGHLHFTRATIPIIKYGRSSKVEIGSWSGPRDGGRREDFQDVRYVSQRNQSTNLIGNLTVASQLFYQNFTIKHEELF